MTQLPKVVPINMSIETCTACNHKCVYCPVSTFPVKQKVMGLGLFCEIMDGVADLRCKLERISFNHYNEPLLDPNLGDRLKIVKKYDFFNRLLLNTNLSTLNNGQIGDMELVKDRLEFNVNLPTADKERYSLLQGIDHYRSVKENIGRLVKKGFKVRINIQRNLFTEAVDAESIRAEFGSIVGIKEIWSNSRAQLVECSEAKFQNGELTGCAIRRPIDYLHVGVGGEVFLCCQDYFKLYRLGEFSQNTLREILDSNQAKRLLGFVYGKETAPDDFICRKCEFAIFRSKEF